MTGYTPRDVKDTYQRGREAYRAWAEPSRQESRSATATIGPPPKSSPAPNTASYRATLASKRERDRQLATSREGYRARYAGPMGTSSYAPGASRGMGGSAGGALERITDSMPWMKSPIYWVAVGGVAWLLLRKRKK